MIERNPVSHLLDGMVKCRHCGTPMETAGESFNEAPRYLCATRNDGCHTPEIEAEPFNRLVVRRAVHAFLSPQNTNRLLTLILDEAAKEEREDLRTVLAMKQQEQSPPEEDQTPRVILVGSPELGSHEPMPAEFADLPGSFVSAGPASRKVEEYGLNPETYLRPSNLQTTKAIMDTLISEILVGPRSATIQYRLPVHPGGQQEPRTTEELPVR
jgi:hypothetical protein